MPRKRVSSEQVLQLPETHNEVIPEDYLDDMGHMNVRWYTHLFSLGSAGWMDRIGLSWDVIAESDGGTFVLESHTLFYSEVLVGQEVAIHARILDRSAKRYHLQLFMLNKSKQDLAATNEIVIAHVHLPKRRQAALPEVVQDSLDVWIQRHQALDWEPPVCGVMKP